MTTATEEILLWPAGAAAAAASPEETFRDPDGGLRIRNVSVPALTPLFPAPGTANGTAVIIAPGGGFFMLSWDSEGTDVAEWLRSRGVTCFVLKYRLLDTGPTMADLQGRVAEIASSLATRPPSPSTPLEGTGPAAEDAARAVELVRERAGEWGVRPDRVGLLGFSAGAFATARVVLGAEPTRRPDFFGLVYGGMLDAPVPDGAPPLFALVAADDPICYDGCLAAVPGWRAAGRPAELHVYGEGGHGFGMARRGLPVDSWIERFEDWMRARGLLGDRAPG